MWKHISHSICSTWIAFTLSDSPLVYVAKKGFDYSNFELDFFCNLNFLLETSLSLSIEYEFISLAILLILYIYLANKPIMYCGVWSQVEESNLKSRDVATSLKIRKLPSPIQYETFFGSRLVHTYQIHTDWNGDFSCENPNFGKI